MKKKTGHCFELLFPEEKEMRSPVQFENGGWGVRWKGCGLLRDISQSPLTERRFQFKTALYEIEGRERHVVQLWHTLIGIQGLPSSTRDQYLKLGICNSRKLIDTVCEIILEKLISETPPVGPTPEIVLVCFRLEIKNRNLYLVAPGRHTLIN